MQGRCCRYFAFGLSVGSLALLGLIAASCSKLDNAGPPPLPETSSVSKPAPAADADKEVIGEDETSYLWDIEHHGNLLGKYGFKPMAEALSNADRAALSHFLAADFSGQTLGNPRSVRMTSDFGAAERLEDSGSTPAALTAAAFVDLLLDLRKPFSRSPKTSFSLMTLSPVKRGDLDGPWQGTSMLRMWGETQPGQPREVTLFVSYRIAKPVREGLSSGQWLHTCAITQAQVAHASRYLMREAARERGIDVDSLYDSWNEKQRSNKSAVGGIYVCDFNRDGYLDLLVTDPNRFVLYKGLPDGKFKDVTSEMGLPSRPMGYTPSSQVAGFIDVDGDGWEDMILGGYFYRNDQGKRFVLTPTTPSLPQDAIDVAVADYDCDGKVDLYIIRVSEPYSGSWLSGRAGKPRNNLLWRNQGNWRFEDVTESAGGVGGGGRSTFSAVWLDANNDGLPDLYVINEFGNGVLYVNQGNGRFRDHVLVDHPCDFGTMGVTCGDIDNDGNIDIYCANMYSKAGSRVMSNLRADAYPPDIMAKMRRFIAGSQLHHNRGDLKFEQVGPKWQISGVGWAYGPALVDLDNDGYLDLFATCGYISRDRSEPDG
jgi:hypothetical protein